MLYKLSKDKKTCVKIVSWKYMLSNNGKCPKTQGKKKFINLKTGKAACNAAAKALGLPDTADDASIKKAFRKLALMYHPDRNPTNVEEATEVAD